MGRMRLGMTDKTVRNNDSRQARCTITWLDLWAQGGHLLATASSTTTITGLTRPSWLSESLRRSRDWYQYHPDRLPRRVNFIVHGIGDPDWATRRFGVAQDMRLMNIGSDSWG